MEQEDKDYCVYAHLRKDNHSVVYIGEGRKSRAKKISSNAGRNKEYNRLVENPGLYCEILAEGLTKQEAEECEKFMIEGLKKCGILLTNVNKGTTAGKVYRKEDFEDKFYCDSSSPSGLRWKVPPYNKPNRKDTVVGCKSKVTGYWQYLNFMCHRIVYALNHGICPADLTIDHVDTNKDNNCISNLELVSRGENSRRCMSQREPKRGSDVSGSKLTEKQILEIYNLFLEGKSNDDIAALYCVHSRYVSLVRHGKRWKYMYDDFGHVFPESFTEGSVTVGQILEAYDLIHTTTLSNKSISEKTNIEVSTISRLRHGKIYRRLIERERK